MDDLVFYHLAETITEKVEEKVSDAHLPPGEEQKLVLEVIGLLADSYDLNEEIGR